MVRRTFDRVEDAIRTVVAQGQDAGEFRADTDARTLARQVQSAYYGLRVLSRVQDRRAHSLSTVRATLDALAAPATAAP